MNATIVNGYEIAKIEFSTQWACIKIGEIRGKSFKTKSAAVTYAKVN